MKRLIFLLPLLWVVSALPAACLSGRQGRQAMAADTPVPVACIVAPHVALPGELVELQTLGSEGNAFAWSVYPQNLPDAKQKHFRVYEDGRVAAFASRHAGKYVFVLAVAADDQVAITQHVLDSREDGPDPDPKPDPDPVPPPPPPGPVEELTVLIVEELGQRTPEAEDVIRDRAWSKWLEDNGHKWRLATKTGMEDEEGNVPADLAPWLQQVDKLPCVFFIDAADLRLLHKYDVPESWSTEAFLKLIKQYGAEK